MYICISQIYFLPYTWDMHCKHQYLALLLSWNGVNCFLDVTRVHNRKLCIVYSLLTTLFWWLTGNEWVNWTNVRKGILADLWLLLITLPNLCVLGGISSLHVIWIRKTYSFSILRILLLKMLLFYFSVSILYTNICILLLAQLNKLVIFLTGWHLQARLWLWLWHLLLHYWTPRIKWSW